MPSKSDEMPCTRISAVGEGGMADEPRAGQLVATLRRRVCPGAAAVKDSRFARRGSLAGRLTSPGDSRLQEGRCGDSSPLEWGAGDKRAKAGLPRGERLFPKKIKPELNSVVLLESATCGVRIGIFSPPLLPLLDALGGTRVGFAL